MDFSIVIPARYASTRFPGKPLALIGDKPMIWHVYQRALEACNADNVYIATDDTRIFRHVTEFCKNTILTSASHESGTDRIIEAVEKAAIKSEIIINIQGDEPFIKKEQILEIANSLRNTNFEIATLKIEISDSVADNPNIVKVVSSLDNKALYFSRSKIPYPRGSEKVAYFKHIGIYGYKTSAITKIKQLNQTMLEKAESLEQLRWLENGLQISVTLTNWQSPAVDTPEDLVEANKFWHNLR